MSYARSTPHHEVLPAIPYPLFTGASYCLGVQALWQAVNDLKGLSLLTGDRGVGKTTLVKSFLKNRNKSFRIAHISDCTIDRSRMFGLLVKQLNIHPLRDDADGHRQALKSFAADLASGHRMILIFDNAQDLSDDSLEAIGALVATRKPGLGLQVILIGEPRLCELLNAPKFAWLDQMIGVRGRLGRYTRPEAHDYLRHLMQTQPGNHARWSRSALNLVVWFSRGVACDIRRLFQFAAARAEADGSPLVMPRHVELAAAHCEMPAPHGDKPRGTLHLTELMRVAAHWGWSRRDSAAAGFVGTAALFGAIALALSGLRTQASWIEHRLFQGRNRQSPIISSDRPDSSVNDTGGERRRRDDRAAIARASVIQAGSAADENQGPEHLASFPSNVWGGAAQASDGSLNRKRGAARQPATSAPKRRIRHRLRRASGAARRDRSQTNIAASAADLDLMRQRVALGDAAMADGQYDFALSQYRKALTLNPESLMILGRIKRAYRAKSAEPEVIQ